MKTDLNDILTRIGKTPAEVVSGIRKYSESARVLSSNHPRLIDSHDNKWIGVHDGRVEFSADSFESLTEAIFASHIPADEVIVRHITRKERTMIL